MEQKNKRSFICAGILLIVHLAGIIGLQTAYRELFLALTPINLLLSAALLLFNHQQFNKHFIVFAITVFLCGYFIEVVGVRTHVIFGPYWYKDTLGWKLLNVPVVIGVNWLILVYSAGVISNKWNANIFLKSGLGALLLVILDVLIEQNAHKYGFWSWLDGDIPLQNYIAWFIISFIFLLLFHSLHFRKENKLAPVLYIVQLLFFGVLLFL